MRSRPSRLAGAREAPTMPGVPLVGLGARLLPRAARDPAAGDARARRRRPVLPGAARAAAGPARVYAPECVQHVLAGRRRATARTTASTTRCAPRSATACSPARTGRGSGRSASCSRCSPTPRWPGTSRDGGRGGRAGPPVARDRPRRGTVELQGETTLLTLRVVGRVLFGADVDAALPVLSAMLPALSEDLRRRGFSPLPTPASWPTPLNLRDDGTAPPWTRSPTSLVAGRRRAGGGDDLLGRLVAARDTEDGAGLGTPASCATRRWSSCSPAPTRPPPRSPPRCTCSARTPTSSSGRTTRSAASWAAGRPRRRT